MARREPKRRANVNMRAKCTKLVPADDTRKILSIETPLNQKDQEDPNEENQN